MQVKQILIAFWWVLALTVIILSALKIQSYSFQITPDQQVRELALIINHLSTVDSTVQLQYSLGQGIEFSLQQGTLVLLSKGVLLDSRPVLSSSILSTQQGVLTIHHGQR